MIFFPVKFYDHDTSFSSQNFFSQDEISYESKVVLFDQVNVSERRTVQKNLNEVLSTIIKKPRQFHSIKTIKEVTLKTRETLKIEILREIIEKVLFSR